MTTPSVTTDDYLKRTKWPLLGAIFLSEPFIFLAYSLLPFLLKDKLGASAFQLSLLTTLRPVVSLFAFYWNSNLTSKQHELRAHLVTAGILSTAPFLLFFFFENIWYMIFAAGIYTLFFQAGSPALMEILRLNLPKISREKLFSHRLILGYSEGILISVIIGYFLDYHLLSNNSWKLLIFCAALFRIIGVLWQKKLPVKGSKQSNSISFNEGFSWKNVLQPWKEGFALLKKRKDFARFQWGFMACGSGIMFILPAIPVFTSAADLTFVDLALSISLFKGIGFALSSPIWRRGLRLVPLSTLSSCVFFIVGIFPLVLSLAYFSFTVFFLGYFLYGIAQGGSHLIWHMSGPIFSGDEESSQYSRINILAVALRGMVAPVLGGIFCDLINPLFVFIVGSFLCFSGSIIMLLPHLSKQIAKKSST